MATETAVSAVIFLLLGAAAFLLLLPEEWRKARRDRETRKRKLGIRKETPLTKLRKLDGKRRELLSDLNVPSAAYAAVTLACTAGGALAGRLLFRETLFVVSLGILGAAAPLLLFSYKRTKAGGQRIDRMLSSMSILSNSFIATDDFTVSVRDNLDRLELAEPFRDFLTYVSYISGDTVTALRRLDSRVDNPYFSEWIDVIVLAQQDRRMKYATLPVVETLNDIRQAQMEADTAMFSIWSEYLTVLVLIFCAPVIFRLLMKDAYVILITSAGGRILLFLLIAAVVYSLIRAVKLNRPVLS